MANKKGKKIARQKNLPGMTDNKIKAIEDAALAYAEVRDERMEMSKEESGKKNDLLALMHKYSKKSYHRGNIHIDLTVSKEKLKVRIKSETADEPAEEDVEVETDEDAEELAEAAEA